jgi:hypothetical protein
MMAGQRAGVMTRQAWRMTDGSVTGKGMMRVSPPAMRKAEKSHCDETDQSDQQEQ